MREKVIEARRKKAQVKHDIKIAEQLKEKEKMTEAQEKIKQATSKRTTIEREDHELEVEEMPEKVYVKKPKTSKPRKKQVVIVESDSSSSEDEEPEVIVRKSTRCKQSKSESPPKHKAADDERTYDKAYNSLFLNL
ncbi:hypothetical protein CYMTET_3252 [Cymbomonas tetramitiformis]|uniref:Uncharacterized protein n=1 Tax=Cymbomonas tetramitiformis TaxID=36881 RepID=A0AAE0H415_9CHLO|nr:hypothetical protein CYMTET_3252 [Cymbomonas tetramitiformis]